MALSLFSQSWYRVAGLKPRLRSHAQIHRHTYRGRDWYVLQDHSSNRFHRFSPEAYRIIGLMDGRRTLDEIWEAACAELGDDMPTQDEVLQLLSRLHQADVLQSDMPPDIQDLHDRSRRQRRSRILGQLRSPLAVRIPLIDPERFLAATAFLARPLIGLPGLLLWCVTVAAGVVLLVSSWDGLTANLADRVLALENLFLLWLIYPLVKTLHEFGHAYAIKRWGGEVHEMGVMILVFVPIPYVDASSSTAFWDKRKRMLVGAAGILTEMFLAALAVIVWVNVEPGAVRAVAFNTIIIAGVSTILFNGNPLLRFDAYYILSDLLEIPNLAMRSARYVGYLVKRYALGMNEEESPASAPGEAPWLAVYAVTSFLYRIFIVIRIGLFVASKFFIAGVILAAWGLAGMFVFPFVRTIRNALTDRRMQEKRGRILALSVLAVGFLAGGLLLVPVPSFTVAEGVLWAPRNSRVHASSDGFVERVVASPGTQVRAGDPLIRCRNADLAAEERVLEARLRELSAKLRRSQTRDRIEAEILQDEVERVEAELERTREEREDLLIRSPTDGVFLFPEAGDAPGRFLQRGTPLGHVVDFSRVTVRVVVPQHQVDRVRSAARRVQARLAERIPEVIQAAVLREVPAASRELPSLALSLEGGGSLALDPREKEHARTFETLFHFEVRLPEQALWAVGERVFVRFEHDAEPLAFQWYRGIRRTFLSRFNV